MQSSERPIPQTAINVKGLLNLHKPSGPSCARIVDHIKRLLPRKTKVGHAGTLDPFASGVLIVLLGESTHRCEQIMQWPKVYDAQIKLGVTTITDDPESPEEPRRAQPPSPNLLADTIRTFVGQITQVPPLYSAVKIAGRRACDLARSGRIPQLHPRIVTVHDINILSYDWPLLRIRVHCGRGTYIRSIARDLGEKLGTGGYVTQLCRTQIGPLDLADAVRLDHLTHENIRQHIITEL